MQSGNSDVTKAWRSHRGGEVRIQERTEDEEEGHYLVAVDTSHGGLNETCPLRLRYLNAWSPVVEQFENNQEV